MIRNVTPLGSEPKFVPVVEARDRKHLYMPLSRRVRCTDCRRVAANRGTCEHEECVIKAAKLLNTQTSEERDTIIGNEMDNGTAADSEGEAPDEEEGNCLGGASSCDETQKDDVDYVARLPRRIMPCISDFTASVDLFFGVSESITEAKRKQDNDANNGDGEDVNDADHMYVVYDNWECATIASLSCVVTRKEGTVP